MERVQPRMPQLPSSTYAALRKLIATDAVQPLTLNLQLPSLNVAEAEKASLRLSVQPGTAQSPGRRKFSARESSQRLRLN
eukprot:171111-Pleurochrysis_carterae.AAC.2